MIKFVLIGIIFLVIVYIGLCIKDLYKKRLKYYQSCILLCNALKTNVIFQKNKIRTFINNGVVGVSKDCISDINYAFNNNIIMTNYLYEEEKKQLLDFYQMIGKNDTDGEVVNIEQFSSAVKAKIDKCVEDYQKKGVFAYKMSIFLGLGVVIVLL